MKNRLREIREVRGFTQAELAESAGVCLATVYFIERGSASPSLQTVLLLARALRVSAVEIFPELGKVNEKEKSMKRNGQ